MKSYSEKRKKQTECVPGSEIYITTKNNRKMMKCKCAECRITKSKFISNKTGGSIDIHKAIGKLSKPKGGWTLPAHKYTRPYNDLHSQVKFDSNTGEILAIYDKPTGATDAIAMQHDVHFSVCGDNKKCKNIADRKMVISLDAVPWNERQWGHWLAGNMINTKQKLGLGVKKRLARAISR